MSSPPYPAYSTVQQQKKTYNPWLWAVLICVLILVLDSVLFAAFTAVVLTAVLIIPGLNIDTPLLDLALIALSVSLGLIAGRVLSWRGARFPMIAGLAAMLVTEAGRYLKSVAGPAWLLDAAIALGIIAVVGTMTRHRPAPRRPTHHRSAIQAPTRQQ
ncbi:hypothetical protein GCM10027425_25000 [Alteromonas gracilis]